jgi:hypothetical protein
MGGFVPDYHTQTFVEVAKLEFYMALFSKQDGLQNQVIRQKQKSNTGPSTEIDQQHFDSIEQRIAAFEKRMNYKCKGLTPEKQEEFDSKFHNSNRMRRWID